jgi:acetyl-CoA C-acetyltransferase
MGQVLQAGTGQITARQAALAAGIPMVVPAVTINKVCLSGLNAIAHAAQLVRLGEADVVVAGGMESMTNAPYLLPKARAGYRMGDGTIVDSMMYDGLTCAIEHCSMGDATDRYNVGHGVSRAEQDEFAARSHELAARAWKDGFFAKEVVPVPVPQRKGDPVLVESDEGIRPETTVDSLGALRPAFSKDGTVTAGNASQISDGAAAVVVTTAEKAAELGMPVMAEILAHGQVAGADPSLHTMPADSIRVAAAKAGIDIADLRGVEINEAFAAVGIVSTRLLGIDPEIVNPHGGAIALGHPIGASGARIVGTLVNTLADLGGGLGAAGLCGGGGQGDALIIRVS